MEHIGCAVAVLQRAPQNLHAVKITFTASKKPARKKYAEARLLHFPLQCRGTDSRSSALAAPRDSRAQASVRRRLSSRVGLRFPSAVYPVGGAVSRPERHSFCGDAVFSYPKW